MPMKKRTAVVTEAVRVVFLLFSGPKLGQILASLSLFTRNEELLLSYSRERDANAKMRERKRNRNACAIF